MNDDLSDIEASICAIDDAKRKLERLIPGKEQRLLFGAAQREKFNTVKNLIDRGVDVNSADAKQKLPVDYAWEKRFFNIVLLLLEADSCFPKEFQLRDCEGNLKNFVSERNLLHKYIEDDDLENVKGIVTKRKSKFYLNETNLSATFTALKCKKFNIQAYLKSIGATFFGDREKSELEDLEVKDKFALREANVVHFPFVAPKRHIDYLLSKSRSQKPIGGSKDTLKNFYLKLNETPEISAILKMIQFSDYLDVVFDFDEEDVKAVNPLSSKNTRGETMYKEGRLYVAASPKRGERKIMGTIAHELTHMAMELLFENECNPYVKNEGGRFEEIAKTILGRVKYVEDDPHQILYNVKTGYCKGDYHSELIVTVPQILAEYGNGREWLTKNAFELFNFYTEKIIPKCIEFAEESPMLKAKNKIRKLNETLGEVMKLKKSNLNFQNVDSVRDFLKKDKSLFVFKTEYTHLGMIKILQAIFGSNYTNEIDKYLALNFEDIISDLKDVMQAYLEGCEKLILKFNGDTDRKKLKKCLGMISEVLELKPNKKIVFVMHPNMEETLVNTLQTFDFPTAHKTDEPVYDFDDKSRSVILSKEIVFQGLKMSLKELMGSSGNSAEGDVIERLIEGKDVHIGRKTNEHHNLEKAFGYVYEKINMRSFIRELKGSDDTFVISGLSKKDEFVSYFDECINEGLIDRALIVSQIQIINSEHFEITNRKLLLTDRFSDGDVKKFCLHNRDKKIHFVEIENSSFTLKQFYNPNFYLERKFKTFVTDRGKLEDLISYPCKLLKDFFIISAKNDFKLEKSYDNVLLLNLKDAETAFDDFREVEKGNDKEGLHWFHVRNPDEIHWMNSLGTIKGLKERFKHCKIKNEFLVKEKCLVENLPYKKVVLIADNPGMGKSTTLSKLYESPAIAATHWVIRIDLKEHVNEIKTIRSEDFNIQDLIAFLLKVKPNFDNKLTEDLLKSTLTTETGFLKCLFAFDGFDEILDEKYRREVIFLLKYIQKNTKSKIWVTTRLHHKKQLEDELSTFALEFDPIDDENKKYYIKNFLKEHLKLILNTSDIFNGAKIWTYAEKFLKYMKTIFHEEISTFIGTPLQLNLMTENSTEHFKIWARNEQTDLIDFSYLGKNVLEVYEGFINKKYEIYFRKQNIKDEFVQKREKNFSKQYHKALAESLARNKYFDSNWHEDTCLMLLIGLIQSTCSTKHAQFIHFTIREYFFAMVFTDHIMNPLNRPSGDVKIIYLIDHILLLPEHQLVRNFINMQLEKFDMEGIPIHNMATFRNVFCSSWQKKKEESNWSGFKLCWRSQNIFRNIIEERNENIFRFILRCCEELMTHTLYVNIITMRDRENCMFLHKAISNKNLQICDVLFQKMERLPLPWRKGLMNTKDRSTILHLAVESGDSNTVKFLFEKLENLFDLEEVRSFIIKKPNGKSALYKACEEGYTEIVKIFLEKGKELLQPKYRKKFLEASLETITSLYAAVKNGHADIVKLLLNADEELVEKEKLICVSHDGCQTVLHIAAAKGYTETLEVLLTQGIERLSAKMKRIFLMMKNADSQTVLHVAVTNNHVKATKTILDTNMLQPEELERFVMMTNKDSQTVFHLAAKHRSVELMNTLLDKISDILVDKKKLFAASNEARNWLTPLYLAVEKGHTDIVKVLLNAERRLVPTEKDQSILIRDDSSQTLLHIAAAKGYTIMFEILLKEGVEPLSQETRTNFIMMKDVYSQTILHVAVSRDHAEIVKILLETGIRMLPPKNQTEFLKIRNGASETVLHLAAKHRSVLVTSMLLKKCSGILSTEEQKNMLGASPTGQRWLTALFRAVENGHTQIVKALLKAERKLQEKLILITDDDSQTVLHIASAEGYAEIVEILLKNGIEPLTPEEKTNFILSKDASSETALHAAVSRGGMGVVKILLETGMNLITPEDQTKFLTMTNWASETVLHLAAKRLSVPLMSMLLKKCADVLSVKDHKKLFLTRNHYSETVFRSVVQHCQSSELARLLCSKSSGILSLEEQKQCLSKS